MQRLSELLRRAMERGVLSAEALYGTEPEVIAALTGDADTRTKWESFRALHEMLHDRRDAPDGAWRVIPAKSAASTRWSADAAGFLRSAPRLPESWRRFCRSRRTRQSARGNKRENGHESARFFMRSFML